jgi:hypothetical protein
VTTTPARPGWGSRLTAYPAQPHPSYALGDVDLAQAVPIPDIVPAPENRQSSWARALAAEATVYGLPSVYQYVQMHGLAVDRSSPAYVGFNALRHDTRPAGPGYEGFKTPNVDTLYSHAWLDLSAGPVDLYVPGMGHRYYTAHLLDAYSNSVNLSSRTLGPLGGTVRLVTTDWTGAVPTAVPLLRLATPYTWLLLRVFVRDVDDLLAARALQTQVTLTPTGGPPPARPWPTVPSDAEALDAVSFLRLLDVCLRHNGHPVQEDALVHRFRGLGIGNAEPLDPQRWSPSLRRAAEDGHAEGMELVRAVRGQRGEAAGTGGWRTLHSGAYGFDYLLRASTNYVGLGGNVREESGAYTTFVDADSAMLDGHSSYRLRLAPPPPVDAFWSLTAYDAETRELVENPLGRYAVTDRTRGLPRQDDGSVELLVGGPEPDASEAWLPAPPRRFYLVLRAYLGRQEVLDGTWAPHPVRRVV